MTHIACISLFVVGVCSGVGIRDLLASSKMADVKALAQLIDRRNVLVVEIASLATDVCLEETAFAISAPEDMQIEILQSQYMLQDCRGMYGKNPFDDQEDIDELG